MRRLLLAGIVLSSVIAVFRLVSCARGPEQIALPKGKITLTGTVSRAEVQMSRRGTHTLLQEGKVCCFLESASVNLRQLEGKKVTLTGIFEHNASSVFLPVLVVSEALLPLVSYRNDRHENLSLSLDVPLSWNAESSGSLVRYTMSGAALSPLVISLFPSGSLPLGRSIGVGKRLGVLVQDPGTNERSVFVAYGKGLLSLHFGAEEQGISSDQLTYILGHISFDKAVFPSPRAVVPSGRSCGGISGYTCPMGQYCQFSTAAASSGSCVKAL